ncbi:uncharacterized protein LOC116133831 [Pistacia vera]|uniref:uncharacterized protein LOC116133831 n=1 Tax=Pistacia vera TaxID=55513 RepID=UPI001263C9FB|nr:uncharacterized protein LOC116133831 [Pistacia vera]
MEEAKSNTSETVTPFANPHSYSNKRNINHNAHLPTSYYYKIRLIARQLRPHFIQVLQTPDFRTCKAAHEVQEQMKLMVHLHRQMIAETDQIKHREGKQSELLKPKNSQEQSSVKKPQTSALSSEKKNDDIGQIRESYIVGGSVFGWNFITFSGGQPVYYGVTRESFRSRHKK